MSLSLGTKPGRHNRDRESCVKGAAEPPQMAAKGGRKSKTVLVRRAIRLGRRARS